MVKKRFPLVCAPQPLGELTHNWDMWRSDHRERGEYLPVHNARLLRLRLHQPLGDVASLALRGLKLRGDRVKAQRSRVPNHLTFCLSVCLIGWLAVSVCPVVAIILICLFVFVYLY